MAVFRSVAGKLSMAALAAVTVAVFAAGAGAGETGAKTDSSVLALNVAGIQNGVSRTRPVNRPGPESGRIETAAILPASAVMLKSKRRCRVGREIDLAAQASGGSQGYEYCFWLEGPGAPGRLNVRGYSSSDNWQWEPTHNDVGLNSVTVWARSVGSPNEYDASATYRIEVTGD